MTHPKIREHKSVRKITTRVEVREAEGGTRVLVGRAVPYDELSVPIFGFREKFDPGAFGDRVKPGGDDVRCLAHHDSRDVLGRVSAGTLRLDDRSDGLYFECDLPDTTYGRDIDASITRGDIDGMSFGFRAIDDKWEENEDGVLIRTVKEASLAEVSPVTWPAYPTSVVESESRAFEAVLAEVRSDLRGGGAEPEARGVTPERARTLSAMAKQVELW
jgi:HK97 family phage prohead protease